MSMLLLEVEQICDTEYMILKHIQMIQKDLIYHGFRQICEVYDSIEFQNSMEDFIFT